MSSMNEYWRRASENDRFKINTSSSDYSTDESTSSCRREYRDASCYVDFDNIIEQDASYVEENSKKFIKSSESKRDDNIKLKSSRYVRWDVLTSLGIGLWIVLCIVDIYHSENSATRDWMLEYLREKRNTSKNVSIEKTEFHVSEILQFWRSFWRILWIFGSGGAYVLLIVLLIVFCTDPRLGKTVDETSIKNNSKTRILTEKKIKNCNSDQRRVREKSKTLTVARPVIHQVGPKLVLNPDIHLHAKILSSFEQRILYLKSMQMRNADIKRKTAIVPVKSKQIIRLIESNGSEESSSENPRLMNVYRLKSVSGSSFQTIRKKDGISIVQFSTTSYVRDQSTSTCSFIQFHIVDEYLKNTRKTSDAIKYLKSIEPTKNTSILSINGNSKTRIITSSPAFKDFLLRFKDNSCVS